MKFEDVANAKEINTNLTNENNDLKNQITAKDTEIQTLKNEISNAKETMVNKSDVEAKDTEIAELKTEVNNAKETLKSFENQIILSRDEYIDFKLKDLDSNAKETLLPKIEGQTKEELDNSIQSNVDFYKSIVKNAKETIKPGSAVNDDELKKFVGIAHPDRLKNLKK